MERVRCALLFLLCACALFLVSCRSLPEDGETAVENDYLFSAACTAKENKQSGIAPPEQSERVSILPAIANQPIPALTDVAELPPNVHPEGHILSEEEKNIADALILVLHGRYTNVIFNDYPIIELFEGTDVEVSYVQGYYWRAFGLENTKLLELAPDGITCFLRAPEQALDGSIYAVLNWGEKRMRLITAMFPGFSLYGTALRSISANATDFHINRLITICKRLNSMSHSEKPRNSDHTQYIANFCLDDNYIYVRIPFADSLNEFVLLAVPRNEL